MLHVSHSVFSSLIDKSDSEHGYNVELSIITDTPNPSTMDFEVTLSGKHSTISLTLDKAQELCDRIENIITHKEYLVEQRDNIKKKINTINTRYNNTYSLSLDEHI